MVMAQFGALQTRRSEENLSFIQAVLSGEQSTQSASDIGHYVLVVPT